MDRAGEEAARLARITEQLLFLARLTQDRIQPRLERTAIGPLLSRSAEHAAARARAAGVSVVGLVPDLLGLFDPWPRSIRIVSARPPTTWLTTHSVSPRPGMAIVVAARAGDPGLVIEVRDQGPGFPEGFLAHAFERFARPDTGRARSDGELAGLAIVSAVAQAHGGRAGVRNLPGGGAAVTLEFPGHPGPG